MTDWKLYYPKAPIPTDRQHEFFSHPLAKNDPVLATWRRHFHEKGVKTVEREGPWGIQIYLHRVSITEQGTRRVKWCCSDVIHIHDVKAAKRRRACRSLKAKKKRDGLAPSLIAQEEA